MDEIEGRPLRLAGGPNVQSRRVVCNMVEFGAGDPMVTKRGKRRHSEHLPILHKGRLPR